MNDSFQPVPAGKDPVLWEKARRRSQFKVSLLTYVLVNSFLVGIWAVTSYQHGEPIHFWPVWPIMGWGIGILFQYFYAYGNNRYMSTEQEYEKLEKQSQ